jgi:hypothetical protein
MFKENKNLILKANFKNFYFDNRFVFQDSNAEEFPVCEPLPEEKRAEKERQRQRQQAAEEKKEEKCALVKRAYGVEDFDSQGDYENSDQIKFDKSAEEIFDSLMLLLVDNNLISSDPLSGNDLNVGTKYKIARENTNTIRIEVNKDFSVYITRSKYPQKKVDKQGNKEDRYTYSIISEEKKCRPDNIEAEALREGGEGSTKDEGNWEKQKRYGNEERTFLLKEIQKIVGTAKTEQETRRKEEAETEAKTRAKAAAEAAAETAANLNDIGSQFE